MREVVSHTAAALHQLHLFLVDADDGSVGVGIAVESYHEAVGERSHLEMVSDAGHRRTGRNDVAEMIQEVEHLLRREGVGVLLFDACHLVGDAPMHVAGTLLIDVAIGILHGILVHPDAGRQFVAGKILKGSLEGFVIRVSLFHNKLW